MAKKSFQVVLSVSAAFASNYLLTNVFPYVGFMVVHFTGGTKEEAGYRAGLLAASFMFARIPASVVWGFMADRVGRKPVLLLGCLTMCVFQILFGLAPSFEVAIVARLLMGLFSGVIGTSKTVASELCGPDEQTFAMNVFSGSSTLGTILGPAISGLLYDPVNQYPGTFLATLPLVDRFPFLLPNIISAGVAFLSGLGILIFVPETFPNPTPVFSICCDRNRATKSYEKVATKDIPDERLGELPVSRGSSGTGRFIEEEVEVEPRPAEESQERSEFTRFLSTIWSLWQRDEVRKGSNVYSFHSFVSIFFSELFPLWLLASEEVGGYGFDAKTIGMILSSSAGVMLVFQMFIFPYMGTKWAPTQFAINISFVGLLFYLQLPLTSYIGMKDHMMIVIVLVLQRSIQNILNVLLFMQANVMVNNSCTVYERGSVNGIVMGMGSVFKALGPVCAGFIFAWSVNNGIVIPPLNFCLSFIILALLSALLGLYIHFFVPAALNTGVSKPTSTTVEMKPRPTSP